MNHSGWPLSSGQITYQTVDSQPQRTLNYFWTANVNSILCLPPHQEMMVTKFGSTNPSQTGFVRTYIEESKGQTADYRMTLPDGRGIHVREFQDRYVIHWDKACPLANPIEHLNQDAPHVLGILAFVGVLGGLIWFGSQES